MVAKFYVAGASIMLSLSACGANQPLTCDGKETLTKIQPNY